MAERLIRVLSPAVATVLAVGVGCAPGPPIPAPLFALHRGDLLFQDLDTGPLCAAIEKVTVGYGGAHFTHVGVVCRVDGHTRPSARDSAPTDCLVLEAVSQGVRVIALGEFLDRSKDGHGHPKVVVGRLKAEYQPLVPVAVERGLSQLGRPYDRVFEIGNEAYYCSELVYEMFAHANGGLPLFHLEPMTFKDPDTGITLSAWADYFDRLGVPVPEGRPGINPGGISRSPKVEIVHLYGTPTGWRAGGVD